MKVELNGEQWDDITAGTFEGPDAKRYRRHSTRMRRRQVDELVAAGVPLVLYWYGGRQLDWLDGADAVEMWRSARQRLVSSVPRPDGDVIWTAGAWTSEGQQAVVLTGEC